MKALPSEIRQPASIRSASAELFSDTYRHINQNGRIKGIPSAAPAGNAYFYRLRCIRNENKWDSNKSHYSERARFSLKGLLRMKGEIPMGMCGMVVYEHSMFDSLWLSVWKLFAIVDNATYDEDSIFTNLLSYEALNKLLFSRIYESRYFVVKSLNNVTYIMTKRPVGRMDIVEHVSFPNYGIPQIRSIEN